MAVKHLLIHIAQLLTLPSGNAEYKCGSDMGELGTLRDAALLVDDATGRIEWLGTTNEALAIYHTQLPEFKILDCSDKCVMPGFIDSHTHIVFAGNRSAEFARRLQGVSYQQIASEGGGILSTMRATRSATVEELYENGKRLALSALRHGTTSIEIKSGYGLSLEAELNQLRAIKLLREELPLRISATFLGAHDFPPEYHERRDEYVDLIVNEMIPRVADEGLADFCDVFADTGYYTLPQSKRVLKAAAQAGMKLKVHADELTPFGAAELAASLGAVSADHLLFISPKGIEDMKAAGTVATLLPGTAYTLRLPYAPARSMIDAGAIVALATDCNPGSCYMENMQVVLSLACMNMRMSIEEAITAATLHGARALCTAETTGSLEIGKMADFLVLDTPNYSDLVYHFGVNHVEQVWIGGQKVV